MTTQDTSAKPACDADARLFRAGDRVAVLPLQAMGGQPGRAGGRLDRLDYLVPPGLDLTPGAVVRVPLGPRQITGVVWGPGEGDLAATRLKPVIGRRDCPPVSGPLRRLVDAVASYTVSPPAGVLRMVLPIDEALDPPRPEAGLVLTGAAPQGRLTAQRRAVLEVISAGATAGDTPPSVADVARAADVSDGVVRGLVEAGVLAVVERPGGRGGDDAPAPDPERPGPVLGPDQTAAAAALVDAVAQGFSVEVLDGVTGSGKTEVYFEAIAAALRRGRQALVLVPEIALTTQWLERFRARFGAAPLSWHSELGHAHRRRAWRAVAEGRVPVVVGARSALFLPFADLGLIVVDEEHDAAFKQKEGVIYHARDMAVMRGALEAVPVVLASATPALETLANVERGRYHRRRLAARHGAAVMPAVEAIDMRGQRLPAVRFVSEPLKQAIVDAAARGEQAMLFINRRGYAPLTLCRACGHRMRCPSCDAWLVEHRLRAGGPRLVCHHCGHDEKLPDACPDCGAEDKFAPCGPGVERLAEEVAGLLPDLRVAVMTSDTIAGPEAAAELIGRMEAGAVDVLIGTQMMAKGYHFPKLTVVGVVDADLGLAGGDLRAAERTYQLLAQVAGRAGRAERPGRVLLQTYDPGHPVIRALIAGDRDGFLEAEADARRQAGAPPYGRWAAVIVSAPDAGDARVTADLFARALRRTLPPGARLLGPAPAPIGLLRGRHRLRLLAMADRAADLPLAMARARELVPVRGAIRVQIDVDPQSFL
ncbi:primosomal protein N' [Tistrella bauzanensis]|uniref:primosomal protein N' n=1 Tax=Tistrella TaxID=171436 RepID=UPI0031F601EB